jgi:homoserine kinase type II
MAVYTEVDDASLRAFLAAYELGEPVAFRPILEGVENSNYLLETSVGRFILTLYERRVNAVELPFFLGLLEHLAGRGVPCPTPVHGRDGKTLRSLCGRPAALVTFLEGRSLRRREPAHCASLGVALGHMHIAGLDFDGSRRNALSVRSWRRLFEPCTARADEVAPGLRAEIEAELDVLEAGWPHGLPKGVIHADLFPDNVFFMGDEVSGLIDFYFACNDLIAYDLAICLNAWCFEADGQFNISKARALLRGYRSARPFKAEEVEALPLLARGAALRFLLTRLYDWLYPADGPLVRPKDPLEYRNRLRFHRLIASPAAYGLD